MTVINDYRFQTIPAISFVEAKLHVGTEESVKKISRNGSRTAFSSKSNTNGYNLGINTHLTQKTKDIVSARYVLLRPINYQT